MTNATKALVTVALNEAFGLLVAFDVVLTPGQQGAAIGFANALLALYVALTYKDSPKRITE